MVAKLSEVAVHCQNIALNTGNSVAGAIREFLAFYTVHPTNLTTGYYGQFTAPKNWDVIMTDLWKCAVSDPTQRRPELLCYDYTDLIIMLCAVLGAEARSIRTAAANPLTQSVGLPAYLDHEFAEVWMGSKWSAQDGFYNVEYLTPDGDYASADDLCGASDLNVFTPRNKPLFTSTWQTGWTLNGIDVALKQQDFFAAMEHRDAGGVLQPIVNGSSPAFTGAESVILMNRGRCDFSRLFRYPANGVQKTLRAFMVDYPLHPSPVIVEFGG